MPGWGEESLAFHRLAINIQLLYSLYKFRYFLEWGIHAAAAAKSLQLCPTLQPHRWQPTRLPRPWDSPGKNTGVGCHCLLQCKKVKSEREVAQSCPTLSDPMDCNPPGSSIHGIFQARVLEWGAIAFSTTSALQEYKWSPTGCHFSFALIFIYLAALGLSCGI